MLTRACSSALVSPARVSFSPARVRALALPAPPRPRVRALIFRARHCRPVFTRTFSPTPDDGQPHLTVGELTGDSQMTKQQLAQGDSDFQLPWARFTHPKV